MHRNTTTACGDTGENPVVNPPSTTLSTSSGDPCALHAFPTRRSSDLAHLAGGTSNATGTITFKLFSDASCQTQVGSNVTATVTDASGKDYTSPTITS